MALTWEGWRGLSWRKKTLICFFPLAVLYYFSLPAKLFTDPYSTVLHARNGELLAASIARDGQWRFPESAIVSDRYRDAVILFEDKRFNYHPGFDPISFARAVYQNAKHGKVISGGSTIPMQVIRLARKGKSRTIFEKVYEVILATRLELRYSKKEILSLYADHAPFGGNVVGIGAACWRYFGRSEKELSWGEAALLAVLPNSPSLIHPGRNRDFLKKKRDLLLDRLFSAGRIDSLSCVLAKAEEIPERPLPLPRHARHLLDYAARDGHRASTIVSTVDYDIQLRVEQIIDDHHRQLRLNQIHNAAAIVASVRTGEVIAYAGNTDAGSSEGSDVDIIHAPRSTGSILKPFLFAAMVDEGKILSGSLLPDVPTYLSGFNPKNFTREYDGAVRADKALIRSLNVPAVHMLREYRYERFHALLKKMGMTTLTKPPDHYGLSLILGGAEGTLWDITGMYASLGRTLIHFFDVPGQNRYRRSDVHPLRYISRQQSPTELQPHGHISASSAFVTFDALKELYRPGEESGWRYFKSSRPVAWKTGTSFGFRDGWAVGLTPEYVVGVWIGNADGEGRPGLTGTDTAAPVLFDIFSQLDGYGWFTKPDMEMRRVTVCRESGFRTSVDCPSADTVSVVIPGLESRACPFHKKVYLTSDGLYRVNNLCATLSDTRVESWFVLPPVQEFYFKSRNKSYRALPPYRPDCPSPGEVSMMDLVYPKPGARIFIPRDLTGKHGDAVFQLAHRNPSTTVFWHLDGDFIGTTRRAHTLALNPSPGKHVIVLIDEKGEMIERHFEVLPNL
jgi:penicillin-binding protein 1C